MNLSPEAIQLLRDAVKHIRDDKLADVYKWERKGEDKHVNYNLAHELYGAGLAAEGIVGSSLVPTEQGYAYVDQHG